MRNRQQWTLAGADKSPKLVGKYGLYDASPIKGPWLSFDEACFHAEKYNCKIGYIITKDDPFTCIDMDVKDASSVDKNGKLLTPQEYTPKQALDFYCGTMQFANSYTELSASGKGLHIWVEGGIGAGRKGKGMEVYSQERFIVCTGKAVSRIEYVNIDNHVIPRILEGNQLPVADGNLILQSLVKELGAAVEKIELVEVEAELSDDEIWARASNATNADKFIQLCNGDWKSMHFPTQSEADLALLSMFTFYSKSNAQCRRMFRQTGLVREKSLKNDVYLDRTLKIIRTRQSKEEASSAHGEQLAQGLLQSMRTATPEPKLSIPQGKPPVLSTGLAPLDNAQGVDPAVLELVRNIDQTQHAEPVSNTVDYELPEIDGLAWPPGLVGAIAGFIYNSSVRPIKEVSIVSALGLMAGITGKAYNVGQTGLNLYIILIARSAIGKEAMHTGIGLLLQSKCGHVIKPFVKYTDYASGPALTKAMEAFGSFINISGEWGRKLKRMSDDQRDGPMQQLRTVMTHLYQKSGSASVVGGMGYSNAEQSTESTSAVSYSMMGETTPSTFYDALTPAMMEDGFLSRFNIFEYLGDRPPENENQITQVPSDISDALANIASHCVSIVASPNGVAIQIKKEPVAEKMLRDFRDSCDDKIREAGHDESLRQIWNRGHLKAIRIAGILAASDNHITPIITEAHCRWAIDCVLSDAHAMLRKVQGGDIGADDSSRFKKLIGVLKDYLQGKVPMSYGLDSKMVAAGIVPRKYLQGRTSQVRCFQSYRMGATLALDHTIKTAIDSGYIMEVNKDKAIELYGYHGRCFRVLDVGK